MILDKPVPTSACINDTLTRNIIFSNVVESAGLYTSMRRLTLDLPLDDPDVSFYNETFSHSSNCPPSGRISPGLLYCSSNLLIFEKPPCIKKIEWTPNMLNDISDESNYKSYEIPIPWQVYFVHFTKSEENHIVNKVKFYFSNTAIYSQDQPLYLPPLTNVYTNADLCPPHYSDYSDLIRNTETVSGIMQNAYNQVWNSGMNLDLTASINKLFKDCSLEGICTSSSGRLIIRQKSKYLSNTVARHFNEVHPLFALDPYSYYVSSDLVDAFYASWEKIPLQEICDMFWSFPDKSSNDNSFYHSITSHLSSTDLVEYLESIDKKNLLLRIPSNDECCEDCVYYDEDGDPTDNCNEEGECYCHQRNSSSVMINPYDEDGNNLLFESLNRHNITQKEHTFLDIYNLFFSEMSNVMNNSINPIYSYIRRSSAIQN